MRRVLIVAGIVAIAAVAVYFMRVTAIQKAKAEKAAKIKAIESEAVIPVRVKPVTTGAVEKILRYTGTVEPAEKVAVNSKVSGRVTSISVGEGDAVAKGRVVAVVDPEVTGQRFEPFEVTAPIAGTVSAVFLDAGVFITPVMPIVEIMNDASVKVAFALLERDFAAAREGTPVRLEFDALPGKTRTARISARSPVVDATTGTIRAEVDLDNRDRQISPGMFARVQVVAETHAGAVLMPSEATVSEVLAGLETAVETSVFVLKGTGEAARAEERRVKLGLSNGTHYEVVEGLAPGDMVITVGQSLVRDGTKVSVLD
jgi:multidrug efflux pump subunit AcrA (membrane-fusion protein)